MTTTQDCLLERVKKKGKNIEVKLMEINNGMTVNEWKSSSLWEKESLWKQMICRTLVLRNDNNPRLFT